MANKPMISHQNRGRRATFERSAEVDFMVRELRGVNQEISYETLLNKLEGEFDKEFTNSRFKGIIHSSKRILTRDTPGIEFGCLRGWGLRRLREGEKGDKNNARFRHIGNQAKEIQNTLAHTDIEVLTPTEHLLHSSQGIIAASITQHARIKPPPPKEPVNPPTVDTQKIIDMKVRNRKKKE